VATDTPPADLVADRMRMFPCRGEINFVVDDAEAAVARVMAHFEPEPSELDYTEGVSADFGEPRLSPRSSNTEPLPRLNGKTRSKPALLLARTNGLSALVGASAPHR